MTVLFRAAPDSAQTAQTSLPPPLQVPVALSLWSSGYFNWVLNTAQCSARHVNFHSPLPVGFAKM